MQIHLSYLSSLCLLFIYVLIIIIGLRKKKYYYYYFIRPEPVKVPCMPLVTLALQQEKNIQSCGMMPNSNLQKIIILFIDNS